MKTIYLFYTLLLFNSFCISGQTKNKSDNFLLSEMTDSIKRNHYPGIHSILISKDKQLVYEQYFNGFKRDSLHDSRSSFKSIVSLLVGIAIDKGFIKNVDQKVYEFFSEYPFFKTDELKKLMTIKNLLEMKSGFDCGI